MQELAATVQEPPSRYLIPEQDRRDGQLAGAEMPEPVPTIDLRRLFASDGADQEATKLRAALQSWGFFLVRLSAAPFSSFSQTYSIARGCLGPLRSTFFSSALCILAKQF